MPEFPDSTLEHLSDGALERVDQAPFVALRNSLVRNALVPNVLALSVLVEALQAAVEPTFHVEWLRDTHRLPFWAAGGL